MSADLRYMLRTGRPPRREVMKCRNQLQALGLPYPKSRCAVHGNVIHGGCPSVEDFADLARSTQDDEAPKVRVVGGTIRLCEEFAGAAESVTAVVFLDDGDPRSPRVAVELEHTAAVTGTMTTTRTQWNLPLSRLEAVHLSRALDRAARMHAAECDLDEDCTCGAVGL